MENPATWTEPIKIINKAITEHQDSIRKGFIGLSLGAYIEAKLRDHGYSIIKNVDGSDTCDSVYDGDCGGDDDA